MRIYCIVFGLVQTSLNVQWSYCNDAFIIARRFTSRVLFRKQNFQAGSHSTTQTTDKFLKTSPIDSHTVLMGVYMKSKKSFEALFIRYSRTERRPCIYWRSARKWPPGTGSVYQVEGESTSPIWIFAPSWASLSRVLANVWALSSSFLGTSNVCQTLDTRGWF